MDKKLITHYFEADHDRLDTLFRHFQAHKRTDFPRAKSYFRNFLRGLKRHIVWEEEILFPIFEAKSGMPQGMGPTQVMRMEHRQIGDALEKIHDKVREQNPDSDPEENALLDVLGRHKVSIASVHQDDGGGRGVPIVFVTHAAPEGEVQAALKEVDRLAANLRRAVHLRIEGFA